jgi:DNA-binding HxlR family transcriptional regulator
VRWQDVGGLECPIARSLSVIGDRWTLLILRDAFLGTRRFEGFRSELGMTRHRLADRLRKLVEHGVLRRERYQDRPARYEYRLTEKGLDLYGVVVMLAGWGDRWMAGENGPVIERVHRSCGHVADLRLTCDHCGESVGPRDMIARPGPAYRRDEDAPVPALVSPPRSRPRSATPRAPA